MSSEVRLVRDATATAVPSGRRIVLPKGSVVDVTQALGGSATVRDGGGIYRLEGGEVDALGAEIAAQVRSSAAQVDTSGDFSEEQVWQALKTCFDPEIPLNIVDLGLIYNLSSRDLGNGNYEVDVQMTLTAVGCGMGPAIAADAQRKIESLPAVERAKVEIVWDPQWSPHMISPEGRKVLGLE